MFQGLNVGIEYKCEKIQQESLLCVPTFPSRRAEKPFGTATILRSTETRLDAMSIILQHVWGRFASGIPDSTSDCGFRQRLASKTINSRLSQNGEPDLDKG